MIGILALGWLCADVGCARQTGRPARPEGDLARGADGIARYCGLGAAVPELRSAVVPRFSVAPDGTVGIDAVVVTGTRPPRTFAEAGRTEVDFERIDPRAVLGEKGLIPAMAPAWWRAYLGRADRAFAPRQALRARERRGGRITNVTAVVPCVSIDARLAAPAPTWPAWLLRSTLGAVDFIRRRGPVGMGDDLAPGGWLSERPAARADRSWAWCAFTLEHDSFAARGVRVLAAGGATLTTFDLRGKVAVVSVGTADLPSARDETGRDFLVDPAQAGGTGGWFSRCDDPRVRSLRATFAGVAF